MGALVGSICYSSASDALDAYYSAKEPSYTAGATSYLSYFEKPADTWLIVRKSIASNGTVTNLTSSTAPAVTFPVCDETEQFMDGVTLGWMMASAILAAFAIRHLWNSR